MSGRIPKTTKQFRRDYGKIKRLGKKIAKLDALLALLVRGSILPAKYRDHALHGEFQHLRDCHVEGDWILLYELGLDEQGNETVTFHATDNHENVFG